MFDRHACGKHHRQVHGRIRRRIHGLTVLQFASFHLVPCSRPTIVPRFLGGCSLCLRLKLNEISSNFIQIIIARRHIYIPAIDSHLLAITALQPIGDKSLPPQLGHGQGIRCHRTSHSSTRLSLVPEAPAQRFFRPRLLCRYSAARGALLGVGAVLNVSQASALQLTPLLTPGALSAHPTLALVARAQGGRTLGPDRGVLAAVSRSLGMWETIVVRTSDGNFFTHYLSRSLLMTRPHP